MSGEQVKKILKERGVNLCVLAKDMGYNSDQALHSALKSPDVKSGLLESIAVALHGDMAIFYGMADAEIVVLRRENERLKRAIRELSI